MSKKTDKKPDKNLDKAVEKTAKDIAIKINKFCRDLEKAHLRAGKSRLRFP